MNAITNNLPKLRQAAGRIAPLWPLASFVAVNPFLGLAEQPFGVACATLAMVGGKPPLPERALFAQALASGRITEADLVAAIAAHGANTTPVALRMAAAQPRAEVKVAVQALTVADVLDATLDAEWQRFVTEEIGKHCAAWCDDGQASWAMPWRGQALYTAWRLAARHDRTPEVMGLRGFREAVAQLPADPAESIAVVLASLGLTSNRADAYLHRALWGIGGWGAALRQRGWLNELDGTANDGVIDLLAIRLAFDHALHALHPQPGFRAAWQARLAAPDDAPPDLSADLLLHDAYERGYQRALHAQFAALKPMPAAATQVQAAFCIDVRSEVYRRALETVTPQAQTIGFAGFFGFALEYVRLGDQKGTDQFPVLLKPGMVICEAVQGASPQQETEIVEQRGLRRRATDLWTVFRNAAVSSFAYVETAGFLAAPDLVRGSLGKASATPDGLDPELMSRLGPSLETCSWLPRANGFAAAARLDAAEGVLRALSLTHDFAPIVLLAGHGSSTVNNPHAAGLDCGACGGNTGESNARVAAAVLNDPAVRDGLVARGITIPAATRFVAGLHDTTTDEVRLYDIAADAPGVAQLRGWLAEASRHARGLRAGTLGITGGDPDAAIVRRTTDWSEVRPEWGLVNNAAFIVAPRARTAGLNLQGRSFLHSYVWQEDQGFGVLELIMTAPMVVANWINLQYYGSTVDNVAMGSGNKVLHNVTGRRGVLEGQGGDLRTGLPMQSLHDGENWRHEPMRLSVYIEAPEAAMEAILMKHPGVRQLVENGWLHLFSLDGEEGVPRRHGPGGWA